MRSLIITFLIYFLLIISYVFCQIDIPLANSSTTTELPMKIQTGSETPSEDGYIYFNATSGASKIKFN